MSTVNSIENFFILLYCKPSVTTMAGLLIRSVDTLDQHMMPESCVAVQFTSLRHTHPLDTFCQVMEDIPALTIPSALLQLTGNQSGGPVQARFNRHHSRARCIIDIFFGRMNCWWRAIFLQALPLDQSVVPKVVVACTILHNICLGVGDGLVGSISSSTTSHHVAESRGSATRDELTALISAPCKDTLSTMSTE